jgi:hypothetical protein
MRVRVCLDLILAVAGRSARIGIGLSRTLLQTVDARDRVASRGLAGPVLSSPYFGMRMRGGSALPSLSLYASISLAPWRQIHLLSPPLSSPPAPPPGSPGADPPLRVRAKRMRPRRLLFTRKLILVTPFTLRPSHPVRCLLPCLAGARAAHAVWQLSRLAFVWSARRTAAAPRPPRRHRSARRCRCR